MPFLPSGQRLPRAVRLLITARAINRLGAFSLSFLTVLITTEYGVSTATAGFVSAAFGLATIPSRLLGGRLADRLGRRRTIVLGLLGCAGAQLGIAASGTVAAVAGFAVLLGLVFELYEPPSQAMIADFVKPPERERAYSSLNAALAAAGMGAGLIAAGLGRWDLRWLFVADALTCLACATVVHVVLPADAPNTPDPTGEEAVATSTPWRDRALVAMLLTGSLFALIYLQIVIALPLALAHRGLQPADAGLMFTTSAATIVTGQPVLRLKRVAALPVPTALAIGYLLLAAGLAGYATAHTLPAFEVSTVCWSLGDLLLMGRTYAVVADLAPPGGAGRYMAAFGTSWGIAGVAAPLAGTQLLDHTGTTFLWGGMAVACLVLAVAQPLIVRSITIRGTRPRREPAQSSPAMLTKTHGTAGRARSTLPAVTTDEARHVPEPEPEPEPGPRPGPSVARTLIRPERADDHQAVRAVHTAAFEGDERVPVLADTLRAAPAPLPPLSFVAAIDDRLVGHVLLSASRLDAPHRIVDVLVLSPLGVLPAFQKQGIGTRLIQHALTAADERGAPLVFLEGSPDYYGERGFDRADTLGFRSPSLRIPAPAFQVARLSTYKPWMTGTLVYSDSFWALDCVGLRDPDAAPAAE